MYLFLHTTPFLYQVSGVGQVRFSVTTYVSKRQGIACMQGKERLRDQWDVENLVCPISNQSCEHSLYSLCMSMSSEGSGQRSAFCNSHNHLVLDVI